MDGLEPAAVAAAAQRRIVRIAEQAFWDAQARALAAGTSTGVGTSAGQMAALLTQLGRDLLSVLPEQVRAMMGPLTTSFLRARWYRAVVCAGTVAPHCPAAHRSAASAVESLLRRGLEPYTGLVMW